MNDESKDVRSIRRWERVLLATTGLVTWAFILIALWGVMELISH